MQSRGDRAASAVVGFVLVFGLIVISFSLYQGLVVPEQNRAVEFDHNTAVHRQFQQLRSAVMQTATATAVTPVTIRLGADYPDRVIATNFGTASGSLSTAPAADVSVRNVTAVDAETKDFIGRNRTQLGPYPNRAITYRPTYSYYNTAPVTRYAHTLAVNRFPGSTTVPLSGQSVVDGRRLTVITVTGDLATASSASAVLTPTPLSAPATRLTVTNRSGPVTLRLPTTLTPAAWRSILADELDPNGTVPGKYVTAVRPTTGDAIAIVLERNVSYDLRLARVGIGRAGPAPPAAYLTAPGATAVTVPTNGSQSLGVTVRDRYTNPVSGVPVRATVIDGPGRVVSPTERESDATGRAAFVYRAPDSLATTRTATLEVALGSGSTPQRVVRFNLTIGPTDPTSSLNPAHTVRYVESAKLGPATIGVTFNNTATTPITVTHGRVSFAYQPTGSGPTVVEEITNASTGTVYQSSPLDIGAPLTRFDTRPIGLPIGRSTIALTFDSPFRSGFFVVTFETADGTTATYLVRTD